MFKRFSTDYTVILFLLDLVLVQIALQAAVKLRYVLPFGLTLDPAWPVGWIYSPSFAVKLETYPIIAQAQAPLPISYDTQLEVKG
jgi:hypothetical protein